jgi:hypothetical protein
MREVYCQHCRAFEVRQAHPKPTHRPMHRFDWSIAIVLGTYFLIVAWVIANYGQGVR